MAVYPLEDDILKRIYHHYEKWEDFKSGMWRKVSQEEHDSFLKSAIVFTGNAELYGKSMMAVLHEWPISCEQNLSNRSINRKAWIGHAAAQLALNIPEYIVREAWFMLTNKQREDANKKAENAIREWEGQYNEREDNQLDLFMGKEGI